jgi:hypothetical protein
MFEHNLNLYDRPTGGSQSSEDVHVGLLGCKVVIIVFPWIFLNLISCFTLKILKLGSRFYMIRTAEKIWNFTKIKAEKSDKSQVNLTKRTSWQIPSEGIGVEPAFVWNIINILTEIWNDSRKILLI